MCLDAMAKKWKQYYFRRYGSDIDNIEIKQAYLTKHSIFVTYE